ncbi:MAG: hypothetical protein JSV62_09945 [Promethearchaeota archaeon]|nr:MAG: hypothetical protein JSV62_09945 [Candidatus Lokiarchaeota archaeon]
MIFQTFEEVMWFLLFYLIVLLVMAIFLKLALGFFSKARNTDFGRVFLTAFLITVTFALVFLYLGGVIAWLVALIITWVIISAMHSVGLLSAIVITVIAFLLYVLVVILLAALLNVTIHVWPPF